VGLGYAHLEPGQVELLAGHFARVASKWALVMTSHDLISAWEGGLGRYTFAPLPVVMPGMTVRLAGDGPSSWTVWLVVNRPKGLIDGTKPGAYVIQPGSGPERAANPVKGHKPLALMVALLGDYSSPGELVCDPFAGSGTTGVACIQRGRRFVGWERDPKYFAVAVKRLRAAREQLGLFSRPAVEKFKQANLSGVE
jgi:site-specific DNA-methyltransferase (adenine-specific)